MANDVSLILAREILLNSGVSSLGVLNFTEDLSPEDLNELSYFDKVEKITEKEEVAFSVWGRVLPVRNKLLIDTFIQLPPNVLDQHFMWKLRLPRAMGGGQLQAHLRPDRIHLQSLALSKSAASDIKSAARSLRILRRNPRKDSPIVTEIPEEKVYSIIKRQGHWVFLKIRNGPEGWTPARGHCTELCAPLIEAGRFAGGILQYVASERLRSATNNLTTEALAVEEQIKALDGLNAASSKQIYKTSLKPALRWTGPNRWTGKDKWTKIDRGSGIPPGGAAFANVKALAELAIKLHNAYEATSSGRPSREFLEYETHWSLQRHYDSVPFDDVRLTRRDVRPIAVELAKASLEDPRNVDILKNLAVLFTFLGDSYRAEIANSLAKKMKQ